MLLFSHTDEYYVETFQDEHIEEMLTELVEQFNSRNPVWSHFKTPLDEIRPELRKKLELCVRDKHSLILINSKTKKIVSSILHVDSVTFLEEFPLIQSNTELSKITGIFAQKLERVYMIGEKVRGVATYALFGHSSPELIGKNVTMNFWALHHNIRAIQGWQTLYTRLTNKISLNMLVSRGATVVGECDLNHLVKGAHAWLTQDAIFPYFITDPSPKL